MDHLKLTHHRHPILIDHESQTEVVADLRPGESLYSFLQRHILNLDGQQVAVFVGGKIAPRHLWSNIYVKHGNEILVRNTAEKSALLIVAIIVLSIFTAGAAAAIAGAAGAAGGAIGAAGFAVGGALVGSLGATAALIAVGAMQVVGALIINKVLGPKPPSASNINRDSVYSLSALRNSSRQYEPAALLFGEVRVTPDVISLPYSIYKGNDQYMSLILSAGINVAAYEPMDIGDTPASNFKEITFWQSGFSAMPEQTIPVASNVDTTTGAELAPGVEVVRTASPNAMRLQVDISYLMFDLTSKGGKKDNQEDITIRYRAVGDVAWSVFGTYHIVSREQSQQRRSYSKDVAALPDSGTYEVSVVRAGNDTDGSGATCEFTFTTLVTYQRDDSNYRGLARIGVEMKATGQFSGTPDQLRAIMRANPIPIWNGTAWVTATTRENGLSNVAANVLKYLRGYYDNAGALIAGLGWADDMIDVDKFKLWCMDCTTYGWNFDAWITSDRDHDEMLSTLALAGFGKIDFGPGKATPVWAAPNQPAEAIVNMGTISKATFQVDYTLARAADGIEYSYFSRETWNTETLRVPAPGVVTMLNPARVTGEGVTTEAHAAMMARYHMGQMLYQLKDIAYSTHIEFMTYGLMSIVQLQHDLTQWGYGGRLVSFSIVAGRPTLTLDDDVPYPTPTQAEHAYIGLRIPGELVYRVFTVRPFAGTSNTITLLEDWPADAAQPGLNATSTNPPHDTIWIYDFKETPGQTCRVVSIAPADDLKSGQIAVVPESQEFWNYVQTGEYIPAPNSSLLNTSPIASNLVGREVRIVQGNTVFSQINISWSITGHADYCLVSYGKDGEPEEQVLRTDMRSASWRVEDEGQYLVTVRPFYSGKPGIATTAMIMVYGAHQPPVNPDIFIVDEVPGGVRKYSWAWFADTIQSSDFAGVEIRYGAGSQGSPVWDDLIPVGNADGFHTAAFQSTAPEAGSWTFALRSINTSGVLSSNMLTVQKILNENLGEQLVGIDQLLTESQQRMIEIIEDVDAHSSTIIAQALQQYDTDENVRSNRAYIARLEEVSVTDEEARAIVQETVSAAVGPLSAIVQETSEAVANINGEVSAGWSVRAQVAANGKYYLAGISVGATAIGETVQTEIGMLANNFWLMSSTSDNTYYFPFQVVNGIMYVNSAMIQDASITNAKIGDFIQSSNYIWNPSTGVYSGWRIDKSGKAQFAGDVEVRGTVYADRLSGVLQRVTLVDWSGVVSGGVALTGLVEFTLPAPVAYGQTHVPFLQLSVNVNPTGDSAGETNFHFQRNDSGSWTTLKTWSLAAGSSVAQHHSVNFAAPAVANAQTYRVAVSDRSNGSRVNVLEVLGTIIGIK